MKNNRDRRPIIFIHYGDSDYLKCTLSAAVRNNPGKEVILLGDSENRKYAMEGLRHVDFAEYARGEKMDRFNEVFQFLSGPEFVGGEDWTRFNFQKMFALENFAGEEGIGEFWLFDSDVLITEALSSHEYKFEPYDYSYHNELLMPQGLVRANPFLPAFTGFLVDAFSERGFLEKAEEEMDFGKNPQNGLTYMYFFRKFHERHPLNLVDYTTIIRNETFNPLLFMAHGMVVYDIQPFRYPLKQTWFYPTGEIFHRHADTGDFIKLITVNLSWLPGFLVKRICRQAARYRGTKAGTYNFEKLTLMHLNANEWSRWRRRLKRLTSQGA